MLALARPSQPRFAYGFWRYREDEIDAALSMLALARENGIDHIDTADVYGGPGGFGGAERLLGAVRKHAPTLLAGATLATKAGVELGAPYNSSRDYLTGACEASLKRLGVERIDLFYIHRHDLLTHPADLAETLDALVRTGKAGAIGVSNFLPSQVDALAAHLKTKLVAHQVEFSAYEAEPIFDGVLDQAMRNGLAVPAWSPLAGGRLLEPAPEEAAMKRVAATLDDIAARYEVPRAAVALAFLQRHPSAPTPILGTKAPERLRDALRARDVALTRREWYSILEARLGGRMP